MVLKIIPKKERGRALADGTEGRKEAAMRIPDRTAKEIYSQRAGIISVTRWDVRLAHR